MRLGARGYRVSVLERLDAPGGRAYVHRINGFSFDAGPTIITVPYLLEELWQLAGRRFADDIDLRPVTPFYRLRFDDGAWFDCSADPESMRAEVSRLSPGDVAGYERFMELSSRLCRVGFEELGHVPFGSLLDMARVAPELMAVQAWRSVYSTVSSYVLHPHLRVALSFHPLLIGGNPLSVSSIYGMISSIERRWGVHFPMGGTGALVSGLVKLIEGQGNVVRCHAEVSQILTTGKRAVGVQLTSGETIAAEIVVSNADSAWTYRHLLSPDVRRRWTDRKVENMRYSNGLFVWYFGTDRRYEDVGQHTITLGPRYKEFLKDIFNRKILAKDFNLYLHRPTATDPSLAPPGCDALVRAVAGAAPRRRHRLGDAGRAVSAGDREVPRPDLDPWLRTACRGLARRHAARLPGPAAVVQGRRLRHGAGAAAERLFQAAQQERGRREPVSCRCRHASRRRGARGAVLRQGSRYGGAGSACLRASGRRPRLTSSPAAH